MAAGEARAGRLRPHVARAVARARHVLLDFDGVMFDVQAALGQDARERAVAAVLDKRAYRPRPLLIATFLLGVHETLAYLAEREPDNAVDAEAAISTLEMDASLTARPAPGLHQVLTACAVTGRRVAVISDLSESAVAAALQAHSLSRHIGAVAGRRGLDRALRRT